MNLWYKLQLKWHSYWLQYWGSYYNSASTAADMEEASRRLIHHLNALASITGKYVS